LSRLKSVIKTNRFKSELKNELKSKYFISSETLWTKSINSVRSKNDLFDFSNISPTEERKEDELFLLDDVSVMIAYNKKQNTSLNVIDSINWTGLNGLRILGNFPLSLVQFNKEIVSTLIRFFMDSEINTTGAVLIFSTHYVELLDILERNDNIYNKEYEWY
jgi:hypothetical protein